ncbi:ATP synthase subunit C [Methanonatronarchaeum sp. AMET6-2]|uniref:ATP synthase subunit C n=1 Tax=Methanonatronarchaeum sp. AMET6-2 TaxID=2933293 RepID=UPI0011FDB733|nr:ATP synthase subunit C [Methanonatronarchaeum sp. AMET6-2]RZN60553.1 MAG: ATPase [Methanonatronarchaeia archaeon]UOY10456.1 ATP synthase subunit C [Methanonatronarchaeum sp. AMET6-2]
MEIEFGINLAAMLAIAIPAFAAAWAISRVGTASAGAIAENPEVSGITIIYVAFAEALAIYGLLISLLLVFGI